MRQYELMKLTAHQVAEGHFDKAILSIGSCEAHGAHLASGTDTLVSYMLSCKVAEQVEGLLVLAAGDGRLQRAITIPSRARSRCPMTR